MKEFKNSLLALLILFYEAKKLLYFNFHFHRNKKFYCYQRARDSVKDDFAKRFNSVIIRIKSSEDFNLKYLKKKKPRVQKEIISQLKEQLKILNHFADN